MDAVQPGNEAGAARRRWSLAAALSESDGTPSFSRTASGIAILCSCGWVTYLMLKNHVLPDLTGLTLFNTALYGVNKISTQFGNKP